ncbi:MAG TPA: DNA repair protein RecO [Desulfovibrio sp.]|uniref:DNA repair protein RecO n=1 Tax=Desulfovibrio TaxID=872 RepID=UPI002B766E96|nr:DNA repair protein RecO [Desulfovibrio sp.]HMM37735.1 DNA repair protein RecO [Desulfovibrio sp.]
MEFTEKALVLKVGRFRENDAWVRCLGPGHGVFTAFAFGAARSRRRFCGCLDTLNLVLFQVGSSKRGAYLTLEEGTLLHGFPALKAESSRLGMAVNCLKFAEAVEAGPAGAKTAFELLLDSLQVLEESSEPPTDVFPLFFRAKTAFEQGFGPDFSACHVCGKPAEEMESGFFVVEKGRLSCAACRPTVGLCLPASAGTALTLDRLGRSRPAEWARLDMGGLVRRQCYEIIERFVAYHLGLTWDGGRFRKV